MQGVKTRFAPMVFGWTSWTRIAAYSRKHHERPLLRRQILKSPILGRRASTKMHLSMIFLPPRTQTAQALNFSINQRLRIATGARVWLAKRVASKKRRRKEDLERLFKRVMKPARRQCFVALVRNRNACRKEKGNKAIVIQCWWR